jgi:spore germination cell wall hydrolase CwlJ-like protein
MVIDIEHANASLNCMALAIYAEAHTESIDAKRAIAQVIINRFRDGHFGKDICDVVYQHGQFQGVYDVAEGRHKYPTKQDFLKTKLIALDVYFHKVPVQIGNDVLYFYDDSIYKHKCKTKIGSMCFY